MANITIIESDSTLRKNWVRYLSKKSDFLSVNAYSSCSHFFEQNEFENTSLLLLDLDEAHSSIGIKIIQTIKKANQAIHILLCSQNVDGLIVLEYMKAGAIGQIFKPSSSAKIYESITSVLSGGAPVEPKIAKSIVDYYHQESFSEVFDFSPHELKVLTLLSRGKSYAQIAKSMHLSIDGVRYHIRRIYEKLNVSSKIEAVFKARKKMII